MDDSRLVLQKPSALSVSGQVSASEIIRKSGGQRFDERTAMCLLGDLLFASRDLAEYNFNRPVRGLLAKRGADGDWQLVCVECRMAQTDAEKKLDHQPWCRTGRVQKIIDEIYQTSVEAAR